jgi:hypothetical protein
LSSILEDSASHSEKCIERRRGLATGTFVLCDNFGAEVSQDSAAVQL